MDAFGIKIISITEPEDIQKLFEVTKNNPMRPVLSSWQTVRFEKSNNYFENKGGVLME